MFSIRCPSQNSSRMEQGNSSKKMETVWDAVPLPANAKHTTAANISVTVSYLRVDTSLHNCHEERGKTRARSYIILHEENLGTKRGTVKGID